MTYEYYKENYKKLTKVERNSNKNFSERYFEEKHIEGCEALKKNMDERLLTYLEGKKK